MCPSLSSITLSSFRSLWKDKGGDETSCNQLENHVEDDDCSKSILSPSVALFLPVDDSFGMEELQPHYYLC